MKTIDILNKPHLLKYQFAADKERRVIRLKLTLAIIEEILNDKSKCN